MASASEPGTIVTNGMSYYARDGENANSAFVVSVRPDDFGSGHVLAGVEFQRMWERKAFEAGCGLRSGSGGGVGRLVGSPGGDSGGGSISGLVSGPGVGWSVARVVMVRFG